MRSPTAFLPRPCERRQPSGNLGSPLLSTENRVFRWQSDGRSSSALGKTACNLSRGLGRIALDCEDQRVFVNSAHRLQL